MSFRRGESAVLTRFLPPVAIGVFVLVVGAVVAAASAQGTLGYDFLAYDRAVRRVLDGAPLYDPAIQQAGGFALFLYPPSFVLAMLPFGLVPSGVGTWIWLGLSVAALMAGIGLLPVRASVRWTVLLLAGLSWPVAYSLKLGQVGPELLLIFAIGWRWMDRPARLGLAGAVGAMIKIQPGILLAWALLTRRWRAVAIGVLALVVGAVVATAVAGGPSIWPDYFGILRNVNDPIATPHNFTPGAVAFQMGVPAGTAALLQVVSSIAVVGLVVVSALAWPATTSLLVAVVASQLLSPVLWDHYAMLLLVPIAFLLERGWWWTLAIPLATSVLVLPLGQPPILYPVAFWLTLLALLATGRRTAAERAVAPAEMAA